MKKLTTGDIVTCTLVTGERAVGFYSGHRNPVSLSYLVNHVSVEGGKKADYAWASVVDENFDNGLVTTL